MEENMKRHITVVSAILALMIVLHGRVQSQSATTIYNLGSTSASENPVSVVPVQGRNGELYGTAAGAGGIDGSVFAVTVSGRGAQAYAFTGGEGSTAGLTLGLDGYLYGTTYTGGSAGYGSLFKLSPTGTYTDLHDFQGGSDGAKPFSQPIQASDGNFYGTTYGTGGASTVYRYQGDGTFTTICALSSLQGEEVTAPLVEGSDGNLYGTALAGGTGFASGTIFKLSTSGVVLWTYTFPSGKGGANPYGPLVQASDGNFYGTTFSGGSFGNYGTVFKLDQNGKVSILHTFDYLDGDEPEAGLTQGTDGALYGTTTAGGKATYGTLFKITTGGTFTLLYDFGVGGRTPEAAPVQDTNGIFYGTTEYGGRYSSGTVYSYNAGLAPFVALVLPAGTVGQSAQILGQNLIGTTSVTFNGVEATSFSVKSNTYMTAIVPAGATTGPVVVTTPRGTLTSNVNFRISE
jgi:uncharacterized repeat protein (TIGR03803 family)